MVYWKVSWFVHNFFQDYHMVPPVYALSRSLGTLYSFISYAQPVLWGLYGVICMSVCCVLHVNVIGCMSVAGVFM